MDKCIYSTKVRWRPNHDWHLKGLDKTEFVTEDRKIWGVCSHTDGKNVSAHLLTHSFTLSRTHSPTHLSTHSQLWIYI